MTITAVTTCATTNTANVIARFHRSVIAPDRRPNRHSVGLLPANCTTAMSNPIGTSSTAESFVAKAAATQRQLTVTVSGVTRCSTVHNAKIDAVNVRAEAKSLVAQLACASTVGFKA